MEVRSDDAERGTALDIGLPCLQDKGDVLSATVAALR